MPEGYPKLTIQGSKNIFTFRFPKFTTKAVYDPTVEIKPTTTVAPSSAPSACTTRPLIISLSSLTIMLIYVL